MKQIVALAMAFAMLAGCRAQPNTPDVTVGAPKEPNNTPVQLPEPEGAAETELVKYELNYVNMSLELPEGWGYAYAGVGVDGGGIHAEPADTVAAARWHCTSIRICLASAAPDCRPRTSPSTAA